jgi:hypothetical protein
MPSTRFTQSILAAVVLSACSGSATVSEAGPAQTGVAVAVTPSSVTVAPSAAVVFAATVTGTAVTSVTWTVVEPAGGAVDGTGRYVAPGAAGVFHVTATSVADPKASASAAVTVTAAPPPPVVAVSASPAAAAVDACKSVPLTATVTGTTNQSVTWSIQEGAAGGSVTAAGVYTAPAAAGVYHALATSAADPTKAATATLTVSERVLSVQVTPSTVSLPASGTTQFTATVTTTCGAFASTAMVTAGGALVQ